VTFHGGNLFGERDQFAAAFAIRQFRTDPMFRAAEPLNVAHHLVDGAELAFQLREEVQLIDDQHFGVTFECHELLTAFPVHGGIVGKVAHARKLSKSGASDALTYDKFTVAARVEMRLHSWDRKIVVRAAQKAIRFTWPVRWRNSNVPHAAQVLRSVRHRCERQFLRFGIEDEFEPTDVAAVNHVRTRFVRRVVIVTNDLAARRTGPGHRCGLASEFITVARTSAIFN
jgi:hypothetical protein